MLVRSRWVDEDERQWPPRQAVVKQWTRSMVSGHSRQTYLFSILRSPRRDETITIKHGASHREMKRSVLSSLPRVFYR